LQLDGGGGGLSYRLGNTQGATEAASALSANTSRRF
jgi:hypothetical protein